MVGNSAAHHSPLLFDIIQRRFYCSLTELHLYKGGFYMSLFELTYFFFGTLVIAQK